ncbi:MAG: glutamine--fructose-6-phosphate transaminase (isomerizing) [Candidatus Kariarchaeaceae archaeon]
MCGIIGIVQNEGSVSQKLYEALCRLEYRGYDSYGLAVVVEDKIFIQKNKGMLDDALNYLNFDEMNSPVGIGHSRWATHGPPNRINSHPHTDCSSIVAVVHNGIIENFIELRKELKDKGHVFKSETDTEVIPHLIEEELKKKKGIKEAILSTVERIKGTFALVVIHAHTPKKIFCLRKDNPLILGIGNGTTYCASDIPAFLPYTNKVVLLKDNELAELTPEGFKITNINTNELIERKGHTIEWKIEMAQKAGFPHYMLKEIHEQAQTIKNQLASQENVVKNIADAIAESEKVFLIAAGTAHYASLTLSQGIVRYGKQVAQSIISAEFNSVLPLIDENTTIIGVSQSGETLDTIRAIRLAKEQGARIISLVNVIGSSITRESDEVFYIHAGPEIGVAATKTYLGQVLAGWRILNKLGERNGTIDQAELEANKRLFAKLPETITQTIQESQVITREIGNKIYQKKSSFYLGRGTNLPTAMEGALKMKEISYIHAEAYPAGESKHGPIALIEEGFPVVFIVPQDSTRDKMIGSIMEMKARGALAIGVYSEGDKEIKGLLDYSIPIDVEYSDFLSTIPNVIPMQMMSYYTSVKRGLNPDKPRNLAKSVTVE